MCQNDIIAVRERGDHNLVKLDNYWCSNKDWIEFTKDGVILKKDAPKEAQESYRKYLEQLKKKQKSI